MFDRKKISEIVNRIVLFYQPERVILFGSYAHGNVTEDSDLDFILVKETGLPKHKRGLEVRKLFFGWKIPLDFKIYTESEFRDEVENPYSFLHSALIGSKILYERQN